MEHKYCILRKHLDELGYKLCCPLEAVPLVERLLGDLIKTTESLYSYKNIAQTALEERDNLQLGAEPYKCDNAKLVKECNVVHHAFLKFKDEADKSQIELKHRINTLENEKDDLINYIEKQEKLKQTSKINTKRKPVTSRSTLSIASKSSKKVEDFKSTRSTDDKILSVMDEKLTNMTREMKKVKSDLLKQTEISDSLKTKLTSRDKEIERLTGLLEGGRPQQALNKDCCHKDMNTRLSKLTEENSSTVRDKKELETQLAEAIVKQHEAMKRALQLADRNKELERELRDIDQIALAVEAECNSNMKENVRRVSKFQDELDKCNMIALKLERELSECNRKKKEVELDMDTIREEKDNLHKILETALEDKKRMTDRINQFTRIEHDLNLEIDRLMQTSTHQKRKISELQCQIVSGKFDNISDGDMETDVLHKRSSINGSIKICQCVCDKCRKCKKFKKSGEARESLDQENVKRQSRQDDDRQEKLKSEKEYYQNECKRLREELKKSSGQSENTSELRRKLMEKEEYLNKLERENRDIMREKHELREKLESMQDMNQWESEIGSSSIKSVLSRVEKERDIARSDVKRLEEERDALRQRLKTTTETHVVERDRLQKILNETEEKLRKLEVDRREMMTVQGSRRATINNLEEEIESMTTQLRTSQSELEHMHTLYSQLKILQEQTDRALGDAQGQLTQIEIEYAHSQERVRELEKDRSQLDKELSSLKNDVCILKGNLAKIDTEKDNLLIDVDNKTERIAALEQELKSKENKLLNLETSVTELKKQLSLTSDDTVTKNYLLKNSSAELASLKKELEEANRTKNNAIVENRRIQEELAKVSLDWRNLNGELERAKREIEDLKTQLQQYVFEIKRAEDLISKKESERSEMLDQFRSLSHEATLLENNNHSLESKAMETKTQLSAALDHISDLESKVDQQETLNKDYEKQISQLTTQIASLETQVKQHASINNKTESDLAALKDLCVKLDEQKDSLMKQLSDKDGNKAHLEREKERMRSDFNILQQELEKEQSSIGSLENLLAASRQETVEQRLLNQELQSEIQRLKKLVEELQSKQSSSKSSKYGSVNTEVDVRIQSSALRGLDENRTKNHKHSLRKSSSSTDSDKAKFDMKRSYSNQLKKGPKLKKSSKNDVPMSSDSLEDVNAKVRNKSSNKQRSILKCTFTSTGPTKTTCTYNFTTAKSSSDKDSNTKTSTSSSSKQYCTCKSKKK